MDIIKQLSTNVNALSTFAVYLTLNTSIVSDSPVTTVGRKAIKLAGAVGWNLRELAEALGVDRSTVGAYKARTNANPPSDRIRNMLDILEKQRGVRVPLMWFFDGEDTEPPLEIEKLLPNTQTSVYNTLEDRDLPEDLRDTIKAFLDQRTIEVQVPMVRGSAVWSAKGAHRVKVQLKPFLGGSDLSLFRIEGDSLGVLRRGSILGFESTDYPHVEVFLLCKSRSNPDLYTIRFIDPDSPLELKSPDPSEISVVLKDWEIVGKAIYEIFGDDVNMRPNGVLARRR